MNNHTLNWAVKLLITSAIVAATGSIAAGQTTSVITGGLHVPNKIVLGAQGTLLVSEPGTNLPNTGRISVVDRSSGARSTLIDGLPSAISYLGGPTGDPDGPSGLFLRGNTLYITIGVGDAVVPGPGQGLELPNPMAPSSPLFDSVLEVVLPGKYGSMSSGFTMTAADQMAIASGSTITMTNAGGLRANARLVANLPDYRPDPRPTAPANVKASHLYGVEQFQKSLYVADAGHNDIKAVDINSGAYAVFVSFPNRPNPLFPTLGGPFIEAVPDSIHRVGNRLLVSLLTGFPFVPGQSEVRAVSLKNADNDGFIPGLTSAIDVAEAGDGDSAAGDEGSYYTLEFSTNQLAGAPGRLRYYSAPTAAPVNIASLITPTSMVRDGDTGNIFVTNLGPGTITKVSFP